LQQKYPEVCTRLLEPLCIKGHPEVDTGHLTYFYHGTASHRCEMVWLVEVVRAVQSKVENAQFEIVGDAWVRRRFRNIPRVRVLHPMAWPDFLAYTSSVRHAVGLAPMLNTHFNRARSHNKLYDITRCGAAGVYSDIGAFRGYIRDGYNGLLSPNDPAAWVERICLLLADESIRAEVYRNALADCEAHASDPGFRLR
jgi:glycosyltransferase involved in cell wall biosynthesis